MTISVVIPCYNRQATIERSIRSAIEQTVQPTEIIVVDDGSTDGTTSVVRSFGDSVRLISQPNAGAASARNRGIEVASGEWIAFLDSDDEWHREKLAVQLAAASRYPSAGLVFCDTEVRNEKEVLLESRFNLGGLRGMEIAKQGDTALYDRSLFQRMLNESRVITSAVMVKRDTPRLRFPEHIWGSEDWALWLTLCLNTPFASVDRILVTMHQQGDNISSRKAKILQNDVKALADLMPHSQLSIDERKRVQETFRFRCHVACYYSLASGDPCTAKELLKHVDRKLLGRKRYIVYWLLCRLPSKVVSWIAEARLSQRTETI